MIDFRPTGYRRDGEPWRPADPAWSFTVIPLVRYREAARVDFTYSEAGEVVAAIEHPERQRIRERPARTASRIEWDGTRAVAWCSRTGDQFECNPPAWLEEALALLDREEG